MQARTMLAAGFVVLVAGACLASPVVIEDGETNPFDGWTVSPGTFISAGPTYNTAVDTHPSAVTWEADLGSQFGANYDTFTESGDLDDTAGFAAGTYKSVWFQFYSDPANDNVGPNLLSLYFADSSSGRDWYYDLNVQSGWNSYHVNFQHPDNVSAILNEWYAIGGGDNEANFVSDLASLDTIGFEVLYWPDVDDQIYGFDYYTLGNQYLIPEPETYMALAMALLSLGIVYRKRIQEGLATVQARVG